MDIMDANPKVSTTNSSGLGTKAEGAAGKWYIKVLLDAGAGSLAAGATLTWGDRDAFEATADVSAGTTEPAGVLAVGGSYTDGEYAWVQYQGDHPAVNKASGDDSYADGTGVIADGIDGICAQASASPAAVADVRVWMGYATGASDDTADTVPVRLAIRL